MIYVFERIDQYTDETYETDLSLLPLWRKVKTLQLKKLDDRKRSVIAFDLLQYALINEYGITVVPEFVYNEFGKPYFSNIPIYFSISHCKDAVACSVSDHENGIDVESIVPYNTHVAQRICTTTELEELENSHNKDSDFIKLWTMKEAVSKYKGLGLSLDFSQIQLQDYYLYNYNALNNCWMSACYGEKKNYSYCYQILEIIHCHL